MYIGVVPHSPAGMRVQKTPLRARIHLKTPLPCWENLRPLQIKSNKNFKEKCVYVSVWVYGLIFEDLRHFKMN
jgi:hypothetical protein